MSRPFVNVDGHTIKRIRLLLGARQCDVADEAGIGASFLSNIEGGRRHVMSQEKATALCCALGNVDQRAIRATSEGARRRGAF